MNKHLLVWWHRNSLGSAIGPNKLVKLARFRFMLQNGLLIKIHCFDSRILACLRLIVVDMIQSAQRYVLRLALKHRILSLKIVILVMCPLRFFPLYFIDAHLFIKWVVLHQRRLGIDLELLDLGAHISSIWFVLLSHVLRLLSSINFDLIWLLFVDLRLILGSLVIIWWEKFNPFHFIFGLLRWNFLLFRLRGLLVDWVHFLIEGEVEFGWSLPLWFCWLTLF